MKLSRTIFSALTLLCVCLIMSFSNANKPRLILLDIGHGGVDKGAVFEDLTEHEINRAIAEHIKTLGNNENVVVELLNENSGFLSLEERVEKIKTINPDLFISIHIGSHKNGDARLLNAFYSENYKNQDQVTYLSKQLLENLSEATNLKATNPKASKFKILRQNATPSIMLELGNLNNNDDREFITSEKGQQQIAQSILEVVSR